MAPGEQRKQDSLKRVNWVIFAVLAVGACAREPGAVITVADVPKFTAPIDRVRGHYQE